MTMILIFAVTLFFIKLTPYIIKHAESSVMDSALNLSMDSYNIYHFSLPLLLISVPAVLMDILGYPNVFIFAVLFISVASYFDIQRKWVPDFIIYSFTIFSLIVNSSYVSGHIVDVIISSLMYISPLIVLNLISFSSMRYFIFASGDFYFLIPLSLWLDTPFTTLYSIFSVLSAILFLKIMKMNNVPFLPFCSVPVILHLFLK